MADINKTIAAGLPLTSEQAKQMMGSLLAAVPRAQPGVQRRRAAPHREQAREAGPERQGYPHEVDGEQHHQHDFDNRDATR